LCSFDYRKQVNLELAAKANATALSPSGGPGGRGEIRGRGDFIIEKTYNIQSHMMLLSL